CVRSSIYSFLLHLHRDTRATHFPYTTLFRSCFERVRPLTWIKGAERQGANVKRHQARTEPQRSSLSLSLSLSLSRSVPVLAYRRSEEHTSELQSRFDLVCRLLLEKKKQTTYT